MRNTKQVRITDEGRDKGKLFLITEMSAAQGEAWAMRVLLALMQSNPQVPEIPEDFELLGLAGLAEFGLKALSGLRWEALEPLLREMFDCVQFIGDPMRADDTTRLLLEATGNGADIEEIATRLKLRAEIWNLHMGFLQAVAPSLHSKVKAAAGARSRTGK
jgi:hypothetical protein